MRKAVSYFRAHPVVAVALIVGVVAVVYLIATREGPPPQPAATPLPPAAPSPQAPGAPVATPSPAPQPTPQAAAPQAGASPAPTPGAAVLAGAGRVDPFAPLVVAEAARPAPGLVPPPVPLPPPLFPGQPGQPGAPPAAAPTPPPPPPKEASTAELVGLVNDSIAVAIVRIGGQTYVVAAGDVIKAKIKVTAIDPERRQVVLEEDGERFELKMGEVRARHVAATTALGRN
jgi:hypothetical protein